MKIGQRYSDNMYAKIVEIKNTSPLIFFVKAATNDKNKIMSTLKNGTIFDKNDLHNFNRWFTLMPGQDVEEKE